MNILNLIDGINTLPLPYVYISFVNNMLKVIPSTNKLEDDHKSIVEKSKNGVKEKLAKNTSVFLWNSIQTKLKVQHFLNLETAEKNVTLIITYILYMKYFTKDWLT